MLPPISAVISVEMLRDGGSLNATFCGTNGSTYCLLFEVNMGRPSADNGIQRTYAQPVVFERRYFRRDDGGLEWEGFNSLQITWAHARIFIQQLRPYLDAASDDIHWLAVMDEVTRLEGVRPTDITGAASI